MRILILLCIILFFSCRKEAKVKLPETKSLPVIYSFICPDDSIIRLKLLATSPLFSSNQVDVLEPVQDGDVRISGAQGTAQLVFNQNTGYYELNSNLYPIIQGQVYKMTVITVSGDIATADTQVPITAVPINTVSVETIPENFRTSDRIKVSFTDEPGTINYYRIAALHNFVRSSQTDTVSFDTYIKELYNDMNHNGENVSVAGRYYQDYDSTSYFDSEHYDVFLYNCSSSYYNFYKSLNNYSGDNPFAEPSFIYTNVQGGFGCFGAYTKTTFIYKKK